MTYDWRKINPTKFELLCSDLLQFTGFMEIQHIGGPGDRGRDLKAKLRINTPFFDRVESYIIQCKRITSKSLSISEIDDSIAWCKTHKPDCLIIMFTSEITNSTTDWLEEIRKDIPFRIVTYGKQELENAISNYPTLNKKYFLDSSNEDWYDLRESKFINDINESFYRQLPIIQEEIIKGVIKMKNSWDENSNFSRNDIINEKLPNTYFRISSDIFNYEQWDNYKLSETLRLIQFVSKLFFGDEIRPCGSGMKPKVLIRAEIEIPTFSEKKFSFSIATNSTEPFYKINFDKMVDLMDFV